ncbi:MAG TPA: hypothetical protein VNS10_05675, partial [Gemmatimonadaceae bacterium]|nr:hypothetical protein [Gemmatimonadaceae bacterium]
MRHSRLLSTVFSAGLVLAAACSDAVAPGSPPTSAVTSQPSQPSAPQTLTGTVYMSGQDLNPVALRTSDGHDILLAGAGANELANVLDANVEVRGEFYADGTFQVADFLVRVVNGNPVVDGVLIALYAMPVESTEIIGYAILPTRGGAAIMLNEPSEDLLAHVHQRL